MFLSQTLLRKILAQHGSFIVGDVPFPASSHGWAAQLDTADQPSASHVYKRIQAEMVLGCLVSLSQKTSFDTTSR